MKLTYRLLAGLASVFLISCDDEPENRGVYSSGVVIANEGGIGTGTGSVTFYHPETDAVEQNIFVKAPLSFAGDVLQSVSFSGTKGYLVLNGSNKIEIVDAETFGSAHTITHTDIVSPRYLEVHGNYAYLSVWGPYDENFSLIDSYILVIDANTHAIIKKIDTDEGTENVLIHDDKVFASNYNYGSSNTVAVVNATTNTLIDQVTVGAGPAGMVVDKNGKVWVLCTGSFTGDPAKLVRLNPTTLSIEEEIELTGSPGTDLAITPNGETLVYHAGKKVYLCAITATEEPAELFTATDVVYPYALGVDPATGDIWIGDAVTFSSDGSVYVYSSTGVLENTIAAGVGPTQFLFR